MMRILLGIFCLLSFVSYGQEYVEIKGIKLGAPVSEVADLESYELQDKIDFIEQLAVLDTYQKTFTVDGKPESISFTVFEGNVESVNFAIAQDLEQFDEHIVEMEEQWGKLTRDSRDRPPASRYVSIYFPSQNDLLYQIHLAHYGAPFSNGTNVVESYSTKKYDEHMR